MKMLNVRVTDEQHRRLTERARREGVTVSDLIRRWIAAGPTVSDGIETLAEGLRGKVKP